MKRLWASKSGVSDMLGHASAPEMACRHGSVSPWFKPLARKKGVLGKWEHRR